MRSIKLISLVITSWLLTACLEDLNPESKDLRSDNEKGPLYSDNFTAIDTLNNSISLSDELLSHDAVVLYFTMWCPLCDSHMSHIRRQLIDQYSNVRFLMVDYVSANVSQSRSSQRANGFDDLTLLVDNQQALLNIYSATMASVIVINDQNLILLNEDYKNGSRLIETLDNL